MNDEHLLPCLPFILLMWESTLVIGMILVWWAILWIQCIFHWHKLVLEALWKADDVDLQMLNSEIVDWQSPAQFLDAYEKKRHVYNVCNIYVLNWCRIFAHQAHVYHHWHCLKTPTLIRKLPRNSVRRAINAIESTWGNGYGRPCNTSFWQWLFLFPVLEHGNV